ncbi:MAG: hypothetical protein M3Y55_17760 [Pseudomonadota bacterium]|nr:hypothetical protein [Pseudomonadota bacterium]
MTGFVRLALAALIGGVAAVALPRHGVLSATQEVIGFLSLLMAGLLPAMILTATILRGDSLSARRVDEYGAALRQQLRFWSRLFVAAAIATGGVIASKINSDPETHSHLMLRGYFIDQTDVSAVAVFVEGAGIGVVVQRLRAAFQGIISLLDLNIRLAKVGALKNDKSRLDALDAQASKVAAISPYADKPASS